MIEIIEEFSFPASFTGAMTAMLFACILLPVFYYIFYAFRKKINHITMLGGIAAFLLFGFFLTSLLLGSFAPSSRIELMGAPLHATVRALCVGVAESGGIYIFLRMLSVKYEKISTPISFGLGYSLVSLVIINGANSVIRLSQAAVVNDEGIEALLGSVDITQREALFAELQKLADTPLDIYLLTVAEQLCLFIISIGITRLLWYSIRGGKRPASWIFIPLAVILRVAVEFPHAFRAAGGTDDYILIECVYYGISVLILALSAFIAWHWDEKEKVSDSPLNRRLL